MTIRVDEFFKTNGYLIATISILIPLLGLPNFSLISSFLQTVFVMSWIYYGHILTHAKSLDFIFSRIDPHSWIHHNNIFNLPRWLALSLEVFSELWFVMWILVIQWLFGIHIFSRSIVFGIALFYILIHLADYSILGDKEHREHHEFITCNYAPSFMDILNNTRCGDDLVPYVNRNEESIHIIAAVFITFMLKIYLGWD